MITNVNYIFTERNSKQAETDTHTTPHYSKINTFFPPHSHTWPAKLKGKQGAKPSLVMPYAWHGAHATQAITSQGGHKALKLSRSFLAMQILRFFMQCNNLFAML